MKRLITASDVLYFSDYQVDNIGELVADNLTHKYRSDGADFYYKYGKQGFDWNSGKYFVEVTCEVSSHYDAEINTNSRYGAYLDGMNGKYYTAKKDFSYNRYDTQDTMAKQLVISLTDDIEHQIFSAVNPEMVETCSKVTAATHPDFADEKKVKFFYKHKFLGACDPDYMDCDGLYDLIKSDKEAATQILNYMNSLGDPVFPVSEEDYGTPETNVDNVDIDELYYWFMKELSYDYDDHYESIGHFYKDIDDFEIFDGPVAEDNVVNTSTKIVKSCDKVTASSHNSMYDDNDEMYKYYVAGYFDSRLAGLEDNLATNDFDEAIDFAHSLASNGDYVEITNEVTGKSHTYDPDTWMEAIDLGDVPDSVRDLA